MSASRRWFKRSATADPPAETVAPEKSAEAALRESQRSLLESIARTGEVNALVTALDRRFEENHFVERMNMHRRRGTA